METVQNFKTTISNSYYYEFKDLYHLKVTIQELINYLQTNYQPQEPEKFPFALSALVDNLNQDLRLANPRYDKRYKNIEEKAFNETKKEVLIDINSVIASININHIVIKQKQ